MKNINSDLSFFDKALLSLPLVGKYYGLNASRIKRYIYLNLLKTGKLRPLAFALWLCTKRCNFSCPYCEASAGEPESDELTTEQAKKMLDDLKELKVRKLLISGGEALVRKDIFEVMTYANKNKIRIGLLSNSYLVEQLKDELKKIDFFFFFTSLDGKEDYHNEMRGRPDSYKRIFGALEIFADMGVKTRMINSVIHPGNYDHLPRLVNEVKNSAATMWHLTPISKVGRANNESKYYLSGQQLRELVSFIRDHRKHMAIDISDSHSYLGILDGENIGRPHFNSAGLSKFSIMPNGEVLGCNQIYDSKYTEGNVKEKSLTEIWQQGFKDFRKKEHPEYCNGCEYLNKCQGGFWSEMEKEGRCLKEVWLS
jgi:radical SAM protein with 4Fe4S-binding SPASM domain